MVNLPSREDDGLSRRTTLHGRCGVLRVFLRYLHRERIVERDLSLVVQAAPCYRLTHLPRSITAEDVRRMLDAVDRHTVLGRRDYAMLRLLVTYGLRAREVAALTLHDIDWRHDRLRLPARKPDTPPHTRCRPRSGRPSSSTSERAGR